MAVSAGPCHNSVPVFSNHERVSQLVCHIVRFDPATLPALHHSILRQSLSQNSVESCFRGKGWMARRDERSLLQNRISRLGLFWMENINSGRCFGLERRQG